MITVRAASVKNMNETVDGSSAEKTPESSAEEKQQELNSLSEKRKALFEPLEPVINTNGKHPSAETLLPPPDFESASYPKGWLIGKKRKLVNVDVVESMRRIAVQEMNRKVVSLEIIEHLTLVPYHAHCLMLFDGMCAGQGNRWAERAAGRGRAMPGAPAAAAAR